jgi:hypothetical protein
LAAKLSVSGMKTSAYLTVTIGSTTCITLTLAPYFRARSSTCASIFSALADPK